MDDRPRQVCEGCGNVTRLGRLCDVCLSGPWPRPPPGAFFRCEACDGAGEHITYDDRAERCEACDGSGQQWRDDARPLELDDLDDEAAP
jgi:hypothetical protein